MVLTIKINKEIFGKSSFSFLVRPISLSDAEKRNIINFLSYDFYENPEPILSKSQHRKLGDLSFWMPRFEAHVLSVELK